MQFYQYLLKNSYDFRNTGIAWLIQSLIHNGEEVKEFHLPDFLDQKGKEFLMEKAGYLSEIENI